MTVDGDFIMADESPEEIEAQRQRELEVHKARVGSKQWYQAVALNGKNYLQNHNLNVLPQLCRSDVMACATRILQSYVDFSVGGNRFYRPLPPDRICRWPIQRNRDMSYSTSILPEDVSTWEDSSATYVARSLELNYLAPYRNKYGDGFPIDAFEGHCAVLENVQMRQVFLYQYADRRRS